MNKYINNNQKSLFKRVNYKHSDQKSIKKQSIYIAYL